MQQSDIKKFMELLSTYDSGQYLDEDSIYPLFHEDAIKSALKKFELNSIPNVIKDEKPVIEIYYDPTGIRGGKVGCIRAVLKHDHRIVHSAGTDENGAIADLLLTLKSLNRPSDVEDYTYKRISMPKDR